MIKTKPFDLETITSLTLEWVNSVKLTEVKGGERREPWVYMSRPGVWQKQVKRNRILTTRSSQPCKGLFLLLPKVRKAHWRAGKEAGRGDEDERVERCFMGTRGKGWCSGQ